MSNVRRSYATEAKAAVYRQYGNPESVLKVESQPLPDKLAADQVLVRLLAAPINPADINMVEGVYGIASTLPAVGGNEGVAVVETVGSSVKDLKYGDLVLPLKPGFGTWRTHAVSRNSDLLKFPEEYKDIAPEYAATVSVNPCTALRLLEDFVKLQPGDVIIQNGANSTVGQAVIQLARTKGVKTISVIRARPDYEDVVALLKQMGSTAVVTDEYAASPDMKDLMSDLPKPKLALNCVGGSSATELIRLLGPGGVMVTYGGMSKKPVTIPTSSFIFKDVTLRGFWLSHWIDQHSTADRVAMMSTLLPLIKSGELKLWMERKPFNKFEAALAQAREGYRDRKIVLTM
eukprot:CAMPEP_0196652470 /NCGR_PEP_ID=MMETSP1086-20130531/1768_1 /TAXON_ID=77921 /ORGANISM="Cyanoptyche  gloeocystis , Strain SAG4.97" /LENGTH=345 /DNA_ID=CAMNT_0041983037 /DNA_START=66 /DNA_END=1103 /DNA_ORIENTATION=-